YRAKKWQTLGRHPQMPRIWPARAPPGTSGRVAVGSVSVERLSDEPRDPPPLDQFLRQPGPANMIGNLLLRQKCQPQQGIMQLVLVGRIRPGLLTHPPDCLGVEPPDIGGRLRI